MLPKPHRLPSLEIKDVLRKGKRISTPEIQLVYRRQVDSGNPEDSRNLKPSRFAVVVPAKVDKRATARNRMKRLVREAVRGLLGQISEGTDGVVMVRRLLPGDTQLSASQTVIELFQRARLVAVEEKKET